MRDWQGEAKALEEEQREQEVEVLMEMVSKMIRNFPPDGTLDFGAMGLELMTEDWKIDRRVEKIFGEDWKTLPRGLNHAAWAFVGTLGITLAGKIRLWLIGKNMLIIKKRI